MNKVKMNSVESSNINAIGYTPENEFSGRLYIKFHRGSVYQYFDVEERVYGELMQAKSVGQTFHHLVKGGAYRFERIAIPGHKADFAPEFA